MPGELLGYWEAHQKFGKLNWKDLFQPTIKLCQTGSRINSYLSGYIKSKEHLIRAQPTLSEILIDTRTNEILKVTLYLQYKSLNKIPNFKLLQLSTPKLHFLTWTLVIHTQVVTKL